MKNFIESLVQSSDVKEHYAYLDALAVEDPAEVVRLFDALPKDWIKLLNSWQQRAAYSRILEAICLTKGAAQIKAAIQIADKVEREKDFDRIAAYLVSKQDKDELLSLLVHSSAKKSRALLVLVLHELIARGEDLRNSSHLAALERTNQASVFNGLCLYPLESERKNSFPKFGIGTSGSSIDYTLESLFENINRNEQVEISECTEGNEIALALLNWEEASNGKILGLRGKMKSTTKATTLLASLPAFVEDTDLQLQEETPEAVFRFLFSACSKGAAYNSGMFGAKGRLYAWLSISRMMGVSEFSSNQEIESLMKEFEWYRFTTSDWFHNEIWDLGILCVKKNGLDFGLVAGTDLD
jgi:hypothetical protein